MAWPAIWQTFFDLLRNAKVVGPTSFANLARHGLLSTQEQTGNVGSDQEFIHLDQRWSSDGRNFSFHSNYPPLPYLPLHTDANTSDDGFSLRKVIHESMIKYDINTDMLSPFPSAAKAVGRL